MRSIVATGRRLGWGVADQAMSSLTNFALSVAVARLVSAADFGAFAVAFTTYLVALNVCRHLAVQPLAIRYAHVDIDAWRIATRKALGLSLALSITMGIGLVVVGIVLGGPLGTAFAALGITLPGLLTQDGWRFAFFAHGRGDQAFRNDLIWTVILFAGLVVLTTIGQAGMFQIILLWGLAGTVATAAGAVQAHVLPDVRAARAWWQEHRDIGPGFLGSELAQMASGQLTVYVVGALGGLVAAGSLRAAQMLLGPVNIATMGVYLVTIPQAARLYREDAQRTFRLCVSISALLVAATVAVLIAIFLAPDLIGPALLGDSWTGASAVLLAVGVTHAARTAAFGARLGLAAAEATGTLFRWTVIGATLSLIAGVVGVLAAGVVGAAWGLALAEIALFVPWWRQLRRRVADPHNAEPGRATAIPDSGTADLA
jgi:O-antigen/teichoic acid export membrane protein